MTKPFPYYYTPNTQNVLKFLSLFGYIYKPRRDNNFKRFSAAQQKYNRKCVSTYFLYISRAAYRLISFYKQQPAHLFHHNDLFSYYKCVESKLLVSRNIPHITPVTLSSDQASWPVTSSYCCCCCCCCLNAITIESLPVSI